MRLLLLRARVREGFITAFTHHLSNVASGVADADRLVPWKPFRVRRWSRGLQNHTRALPPTAPPPVDEKFPVWRAGKLSECSAPKSDRLGEAVGGISKKQRNLAPQIIELVALSVRMHRIFKCNACGFLT